MSRHFMLSQTSLAVVLALTAGAVQAAEEETVVVVGQQEDSSVGPDFSYLGISSRTATKTDLPISETPRAVSVVTREQMDDRASVSISDALQYTPSIQTNYYGEDNKQDWFVIRGFQQAGAGLYQDGTRLYSAGFYSWQIDPFGLERVEILRGPASVLYGQNPPGGVINVVSKRPQFNGVDQEQARTRRFEVTKKADFYGSMDGASKFVKGDAIAGILILFINIIGGLAIGMAQYGLGFGEAMKIYTLLTIGDGLVAQIPSLLLS